jgi:hypothetical protein
MAYSTVYPVVLSAYGFPAFRQTVQEISCTVQCTVQRGVYMARLTLAAAARLVRLSRTSLYRAIADGHLTREPDGTVDTAELLRAGFVLHNSAEQNPASGVDQTTIRVSHTLIGTVQDTNDGRPVTPSRTPSERVQDNVTGRTALPSCTPDSLHDQAYLERLLDVLERERATLQQALVDSQAEKQRLLDLLHEEQRQRQRLLEAGPVRRRRWACLQAWWRNPR